MRKILILMLLLLGASAHADFGEVDLIVRESVEDFFRSEHRDVDMGRFAYTSEPRSSGGVLTITSEVWGEQRLIAPYWGWFDCTTQLPVLGPGRYGAPETECIFDPE